jgi:hypothetical protein
MVTYQRIWVDYDLRDGGYTPAELQQATPLGVALESNLATGDKPGDCCRWERSVFERLANWRPWIAAQLRSHWLFLTSKGADDLSRAFVWEGDAFVECFPDAEVLWLEHGYQEEYFGAGGG